MKHTIFLMLTAMLFAAAPSVETSVGPYLPGRVLVKLATGVRPECAGGRVRTGFAGLDLLLDRYAVTGARPLVPVADSIARASGADRCFLLSFPETNEVSEAVRDFGSAELVEGAWPDEWLPLDSVPDDSMYPQQWHLAHIGAPGAWVTAHGDSNVRLAVVDDGVHWTHPDLQANLWINTPEDINGNRRFDPSAPPQGDLDGIDQDGNGYVDDVIGYDFWSNDPNPMALQDDAYGTYIEGIQNAVTDNNRGVSAPPWNVRSIIVRCGDDGGISIFAAVSGIYYLIQKGAWAFSMPYSFSTGHDLLRQACMDAWNSGRVPCAPVGNDGAELIKYPAGYDGVIAVAAHGRTNYRSSCSNYGAWTDISAPGDNILTTRRPTGYGLLDGSGAACAVVVGVLGWVKSAHPGIGRDSALAIVQGMCDSMPDPLYQQGKLGWGRIRMSVPDSTAVAESRTPNASRNTHHATVIRSVLCLPASSVEREASSDLLDACGRSVTRLKPGPNDVSHLAPGVYFAVEKEGAGRGTRGGGQKVVIAR
ncbi:MAG: S8 family serine peptidase [bacterium]